MSSGKFNKNISRRNFCKVLTASAAGLCFLPMMVKKASSQVVRKKGFTAEKEALWWSKSGKSFIRCNLCPNRCTLREGLRSPCLVREVKDEKLFTLAYGNPTSIHIDPIEKKPLYHFYPGKTALSIATAGCNFSCLNCQNWEISQFPPEDTVNYKLMPEDVVATALTYKSPVIAYTYSEPSIFYEYMLDTAVIAHEKGLKNVSITNGYLNPGPLKDLCKYLDASNVDLKGFSDDFYMNITDGRLQPVLDTIKIMKANDVHVEITNLVLPGYNDSDDMLRQMCKWIIKNSGENTPLHFSRFHPRYKLRNLQPTPEKTLKRAKNIANDLGMNYVYIGNLPVGDAEDTFCHNCKKLIIDRSGYRINKINIKSGKCQFCNTTIPGVWG
jgi:pyruvate formate lyase activating enzyme